MNTAHKGRRYEYKTRDLLTDSGYVVTRSAASKGSADLIAVGSSDILLVQVKVNRGLDRDELATFHALPVPSCVRKLVYVWRDYVKDPTIHTLN